MLFSQFIEIRITGRRSLDGLTENAGRENDGPSKLQGMKLQDVKMQDIKMTDQKMTIGREIAGEKSTVSTEITLQ